MVSDTGWILLGGMASIVVCVPAAVLAYFETYPRPRLRIRGRLPGHRPHARSRRWPGGKL